MKRMQECINYNTNGNMHLPPQDLKLMRKLLDIFAGIPDRSMRMLYSWITTKTQMYQSYDESPFLQNALPEKPKEGGFLTNRLAQRRCGRKFEQWLDAVTESPGAEFTDENCLNPLMDLLEQGNRDPKSIQDTFDPIKTSNGFTQYKQPESKALGNGTKTILEESLKASGVSMIQTQTNNFDALRKHHPNWVKDNFDMKSQINVYLSKFIQSKDETKWLVVHPAHFLIFSHENKLSTRLKIAKDYCLHLDLMIAHNHIDLEEAKQDCLRLQCFFMSMMLGNDKGISKTVDEEEILGFHLARNCVHPKDWFKIPLPGIHATATALGIEEVSFIYAREKIGASNMRIVIEAHGLMKGNSQAQLAPYEPGARCHGTPKFGNVPAKSCDSGKNNYLCYLGLRTDGHPLCGYCLCKHCLINKSKVIKDEDLRMNNIEGYKAKLSKAAAWLSKDKQRNPEKHKLYDLRRSANKLLDRDKQKKNAGVRYLRYLREKTDGIHRTKPMSKPRLLKDPTFHYEDRLRIKMKQAVYILIQKRGYIHVISNNHLIHLLDAVRYKYGMTTELYYKHEYIRCMNAFFEQTSKQSWTVKEEYKVKRAPHTVSLRSTDKFREWIVNACFDDTQMTAEKESADEVEFGQSEEKCQVNRRILNTTSRYEDRLCTKMKQAVYIFTQKRGFFEDISNHHLVHLLDAVRYKYGETTDKYYFHEYNRCILAFLVRHSRGFWTVKEEYQVTRPADTVSSLPTDEFREWIVNACFDDTQMTAEKDSANGVELGRSP